MRKENNITVKIWHGGSFELHDKRITYVSKCFRTVDVDAEKFCWSTLVGEAEKCGSYKSNLDSIFYLTPDMTFEEGLKKVGDDEEVRIICRIALKIRMVECFLVQDCDVETLLQLTKGSGIVEERVNVVAKLTPRRKVVAKKKTSPKPCKELTLEKGSPLSLTNFLESPKESQPKSPLKTTATSHLSNKTSPQFAKNQNNPQPPLTTNTCTQKEPDESVYTSFQGSYDFNDITLSNFFDEYEESADKACDMRILDLSYADATDDEESRPGRRKKSTVVIVDEKTDFSKLVWVVGIRFPNRSFFKECVIRYAVAQGRNLKFDISEQGRQQRLRVCCTPGCPFRLYGSWERKRACFVVKSVDPNHTCQRTMKTNTQLKSSWVAKQFLEIFKARPHWPASDIIDTIRKGYKILVRKGFAYKVKYCAHRLLHGSMKEHYSKIGSYTAALKHGNPNSVFTLLTNPNITTNPPTFQRYFVCFEAVKHGWLVGCRKLLCVDSCFLKTFLGGQLISAVGRDANEQMFPLAWAVVEGENNESYEWFFQELKKCVREKDGNGWTIISDEHPSIISMVAKELPMAEHRHCARHIFANWHKTYRGDEMKLLFWNCAKAYNNADFTDAIEAMREVNPFAAEAFLAYNPKLFCRAFIKTHTKNDVIVNNMAETFNAYIINARTKHLIYMLEEIRCDLMERIVKKRQDMEKKIGLICPKVQQKLNKEKDEAAKCFVVPSSETMFQVTHGLDELHVDIGARTCTCRKWDLTGIPCCHGVAAIFYIYLDAEDYVFELYTRDAYLKTYCGSISPCPGERHWPKVVFPLIPPPIKIGPGRPRKNRRKDPFEDPKKKGKLTKHGIEMSCSVCKSTSHNKRKCPDKDKLLPPPPKKRVGRPKRSRINLPTDVQSQATTVAHDTIAQPQRVGRGGRVVRSGKRSTTAARGGSKSVHTRSRSKEPASLIGPKNVNLVSERTSTQASSCVASNLS